MKLTEGKREVGSSGYTGDLSKWWRTKSAKAALRRAANARKLRIKKLRETMKQKHRK